MDSEKIATLALRKLRNYLSNLSTVTRWIIQSIWVIISRAHIIQLHLTRVQTMLQLVKQITAAGALSISISQTNTITTANNNVLCLCLVLIHS